MKKTVQIVTIPLGESSKLAKKDTSDKYELAEGETVFVNGIGYTPQQLLVLSDDEIIKDDYFYHGVCNKVFKATSEDVARIKLLKHSHPELVHAWITIKPNHYARKVIASYPQIEGTLSISKETVQAWIDSGTPVEGSVDIVDWNCLHPNYCKCYNQRKFQPFCKYYKDSNGTKIDPQGNLILEFGRKGYSSEKFKNMVDNTSPEIKERIKNWFGEQDAKADKLSIPTDEEIKEKAATYAKTQHETPAEMLNSIDQYDREHVMMIEQSIEDSRKDYLFGYKQALKDLGHE